MYWFFQDLADLRRGSNSLNSFELFWKLFWTDCLSLNILYLFQQNVSHKNFVFKTSVETENYFKNKLYLIKLSFLKLVYSFVRVEHVRGFENIFVMSWEPGAEKIQPELDKNWVLSYPSHFIIPMYGKIKNLESFPNEHLPEP